MIFILVCLLFIVISVVTFSKMGVIHAFSKGIALCIGLSLLSVVCLAQNYTQSLIPEANDGIGISNQLAYSIIGEDGWSQDIFRNWFDYSVYFVLFLLAAYPLVVMLESKFINKTRA